MNSTSHKTIASETIKSDQGFKNNPLWACCPASGSRRRAVPLTPADGSGAAPEDRSGTSLFTPLNCLNA